MRSPVRKQLVATFQREFENRYPQFSPVKLPRGATVKIWDWEIAPQLVFFVMLQPFNDEDVFRVEVAWNEDHEYPWMRSGDVNIEAPNLREGLGWLWASTSKEPLWDLDPEVGIARRARFEALARDEPVSYPPDTPIDVLMPRVAPLVEDCLQKFEQYGWPLFKKVAKHQGIKWPK